MPDCLLCHCGASIWSWSQTEVNMQINAAGWQAGRQSRRPLQRYIHKHIYCCECICRAEQRLPCLHYSSRRQFPFLCLSCLFFVTSLLHCISICFHLRLFPLRKLSCNCKKEIYLCILCVNRRTEERKAAQNASNWSARHKDEQQKQHEKEFF